MLTLEPIPLSLIIFVCNYILGVFLMFDHSKNARFPGDYQVTPKRCFLWICVVHKISFIKTPTLFMCMFLTAVAQIYAGVMIWFAFTRPELFGVPYV